MVDLYPMLLMPPVEDIQKFASDFRMSDDALFELAKILCRHKPKRVLETGPGLSTYVIMKYFRLTEQPMDFVSLNHQSEWDGFIRAWLSNQIFHRCGDIDCIKTVDLDDKGWYKYKWEGPPADFIVLDGPLESSARNSHGANMLILNASSKDTIFLVDDVHRKSEEEFSDYIKRHYVNVKYIQDTLYPKRMSVKLSPYLEYV